ncbi:3-oxoacyl-ACP synthase III family protein [Paenarthrobacter nicotinovorans]|uniref:3-oxoacyl-ACP synthase III family protein n=1 Tax=Paenarthrobacter nicotinovorans TaxID=29320 RepID=UPI0016686892|nr:3-oxoacyl-[acyl-carrier-protein] synthase III C-terminal domain-containing protein [Paenarthrobacter nicotinovorans]MBP2395792.1 3-oxoacyl-[acyl-carrier-protein] synthase-3 [Paenarthrobacter nicotinovorans]UKE98101.1 ketoacyl-ACP synthase III [Paenarthrobacter nicotinovorans]UKF02888.1 ketoacyl-ACP synthase III [Paenarthrobacter nicotinovorans]
MQTALSGRSRISGLEVYLPPTRLDTAAVERRIAESSPGFRVPTGLIGRVTGIRSRSVMSPTEQASDLAANAAAKVLAECGLQAPDVDLLVFASASQDMVEPATGHMVAAKLGLSCPVMDVKNACNSFLNGMEVADALIAGGRYGRVLVVTGESPSRAVRWSVPDFPTFASSFPGYTMSDGGAAVLLEAAVDPAAAADGAAGILAMGFTARSSHWSVGTLAAGGSAFPRDPEASYFNMDGEKLKDAFLDLGSDILDATLAEMHLAWTDFAVVCVHQVSAPYRQIFAEGAGVPADLLVHSVEDFGNLASVSLPLQLKLAVDSGRAGPGDLVALVGLGGGVSLGMAVVRL